MSPDEKPVPGFCLGAVNVLGGKGMQMSLMTENAADLCRLLIACAKETLPNDHQLGRFPFSSIQVNYNYCAKRHVDGNNIGPSYILSLGRHTGGELWVADTFVKDHDGLMRGGGGEAILNPRRQWLLFNGCAEHETRPFSGPKRISIVLFTHSSYNELPVEVAVKLTDLGFTACTSTGRELDFFASFRLDKTELAGEALDSYFKLKHDRRATLPPPTKPLTVCVECNGYTAGKGAGWISFVAGGKFGAKRRRIDAFFKPHNQQTKKDAVAYDLPHNKNKVATRDVLATVRDSDGLFMIELPKNRTGLWLAVLDFKASVLSLDALERFDVYADTIAQTDALVHFVRDLATGKIVVCTITDTAMAKTRPLGKAIYDALGQLGAPVHIEPIGYRQPFCLIGIKGAPRGTAVCKLDKTKVIIRAQAKVQPGSPNNDLVDKLVDCFDITSHIVRQSECSQPCSPAPQ